MDVVGRHLDRLGLGVPVRRLFGDVRDEPVWRELLDVDVVLGCTDTHGSRAILNDLASGYLLPVIDVGVQAGAKKNADLAALVAETSVLTPVTPCLWCRGRISAEVIRAENLPADQRDRLVREGYLVGGVGEPAPSVMALTALGAALATCALLAMLSSEGESQFRSAKFVRLLRSNGLVGSMGRVGACADNAAMESFFALLQKNVLDRRRWQTREELRLAIVIWIERTYHRRRRQRGLGKLTPIEFETIHEVAHAA